MYYPVFLRQINMPSGAYVKMDVHEWGMNVYSYAPSEDINKTEGLCGTFDGNRSNDLRLRGSGRVGQLDEFIESWRWVSHAVSHVGQSRGQSRGSVAQRLSGGTSINWAYILLLPFDASPIPPNHECRSSLK